MGHHLDSFASVHSVCCSSIRFNGERLQRRKADLFAVALLRKE
jgi:hypothetical protein